MPGDMFYTRRQFLHSGLVFVGASGSVPSFLLKTAACAEPTGQPTSKRSRDHRILVVVQLAGGNDGLNTLVPYENDVYYRLRPTLAIKKDAALKLDKELGLHPAATGLKALFDQGHLAVVRGVGYPNPNRSHFKSMDIWQTASPTGREHEGWLGRYFDSECRGVDPVDPSLGIALLEEAPLALRGETFLPIAFDKPDRLSLKGFSKDRKKAAEIIARLNRPVDEEANKPATTLDFLRRTALDAQLCATEIRNAANEPRSNVTFPGNELGKSLELVHRMITGGLPTRVYYVSQGGFDTHANQSNRHAGLLGDLAASMEAFIAALKESGDLDRVLLMTFSEFGRRVSQNASGGTDHGSAAPMFLAGGPVQPGMHGRSPSLDKLVDGDLGFTIDFRQVYATVLKDWLEADPLKLLGGKFAPLKLFRI